MSHDQVNIPALPSALKHILLLMDTFEQVLFLPFRLGMEAHTAVHRFVAHGLGLPSRYRGNAHLTIHVEYLDWRLYCALLAPLLVGISFILALVDFGLYLHARIFFVIAAGVAMFWLPTCVSDLWIFAHTFRHRRLPHVREFVFADAQDDFNIPSELFFVKMSEPLQLVMRDKGELPFESILARLERETQIVEIDNLMRVLALPFALPHEFCHYGAARVLRVPVKLRWHYVRLNGRADTWQLYIITVAPALLGIIGCLTLLSIAWLTSNLESAPVILLVTALWLTTCAADLYSLAHHLRVGKWARLAPNYGAILRSRDLEQVWRRFRKGS